MSGDEKWLSEAFRVLDEEATAIVALGRRIRSSDIVCAVKLLLNCTGRVVVTGMGKSGAVGRKFASTLASTGTPALFLHPADGVHGDLGMIASDDVIAALSYSGETEELLAILPALSRLKVPIIAFTAHELSSLGKASRVTLDVHVDKEACILSLAPTTSTTVMLALSDAIAVAVMSARSFTSDEYAERHPGGSLGRRLLLRVSDVMRTGEAAAVVTEETSLRDTLFAITSAHAGAAVVVDTDGKAIGLITDGDARRRLLDNLDYWERPVRETMNRKFGTVPEDIPAYETLRLLESYHPDAGTRVGEAPVVDGDGRPVGMLMLKDLVKAGIV
jgi:arabinose-5-phosphate isomerase